MKLHRWFFVVSPCLAFSISGCIPLIPPTQNAPPVTSVRPIQEGETLSALTQLTGLKEQLKHLRNAVEEIQFDTENAKRRQHNLFQDLDRRLLSLEREQRLLSLQPQTTTNGQDTTPNDNLETNSNNVAGNADAALVVAAETAGNTTTTSVATTQASTVPQTDRVTETPPTTSVPTDTVSLPEQQAYDRAFSLLKQSKYQDAINQFQELADTWPNSLLADDAIYWQSEARYVNRETEAALHGFRSVLTRYPNSERVPEALLKIGYIHYDIGAYQEAAEIFRDVLSRFPAHQVAVSAQTRLRRIEQTIQ